MSLNEDERMALILSIARVNERAGQLLTVASETKSLPTIEREHLREIMSQTKTSEWCLSRALDALQAHRREQEPGGSA